MTKPRHVKIHNIEVGNDLPFALIAGPCQLESRAHALEMCGALTELTRSDGCTTRRFGAMATRETGARSFVGS